MHVSRSAGVGLLAGGAHRTAAATYASRSCSPSPARTDSGWFAKPVRCSDAKRKSPERSPVNTRPVRLPPCAAGASPTSSSAGVGVAESRHRATPVLLVAERRPLLAGDRFPPLDQPRTRAARDDLARSARRGRAAGTACEPTGGAPLPSGRCGCLLLVNATASSVTARKRVMIRKLLAAQHEVEVAETSRRGHATRLAHAAANDGFDVVVVLAGDGTLNEAADGLLHTDTALAPLPGGSTNVYARTLGYLERRDRRDQRAARARSTAARTKRIGVGRANRRPFLFNTGHRFRRRGDPPGRALRRAEAPLLAPAAHRGRVRGVLPAARARRPASTSSSTPARRSRACASRSSRRPIPYTYLGRLPLRVAPDAGPRPAARAHRVPARSTRSRCSAARHRRCARASSSRTARGIDHRARSAPHHRAQRASRSPYQVDGDDVGEHRTTRHRVRTRRAHVVVP